MRSVAARRLGPAQKRFHANTRVYPRAVTRIASTTLPFAVAFPLHSRGSPRKCKGDEGEEKEEANREAREREVSVRLYAVNVHSLLSTVRVIRLSGSAAKNGQAPK